MADLTRIAPTPSPRTAVVWAVILEELDRRWRSGGDTEPRVLDAGGGTGGFAVPLAEAGCAVTVIDPSPDALAALARRAAERHVGDRITAMQGDADDLAALVPAASVDLVLCHSMLEVVEDPSRTVAAVAAALRPGGCASLLVANRAAAVLSRALAGHFTAAHAVLADPAGRTGGADTVLRRFDVDSITALAVAAGLAVEQVHGVRVLADLVPGAVVDAEPGGLGALLALEHAAAHRPPYRDVATQLHVLARR